MTLDFTIHLFLPRPPFTVSLPCCGPFFRKVIYPNYAVSNNLFSHQITQRCQSDHMEELLFLQGHLNFFSFNVGQCKVSMLTLCNAESRYLHKASRGVGLQVGSC